MAKEDKKKEDEMSEEELKSIQADAELAEAKRLQAVEDKKKEKAEKAEGSKMYSQDEMMAMVRKAISEERAKAEGGKVDDMDEVDPYAQKKLTIPRFPAKDGKWKFILGFANTNTDEYFKDKVVQAFDIWDDMQKKNVAYVKVIFDDESEMTLPLFTVIKRSQKVLVDIVETSKVNKSYSAGRTEKVKIDGYKSSSEGTVVMKVTQYDYSFIVRLPDGKELKVGKEVVNWNIIPEKN